MQRAVLILLAATVLAWPGPIAGCPAVRADREAVVQVSLSALRRFDIVVRWTEWSGGGRCTATVETRLSELPSRSLRPRPSDFAGDLVRILDDWDVDHCRIGVGIRDDVSHETEATDECYVEGFAYEGERWWSIESERSCWEHPVD